jgi:hypothetical protein
MSIQEKKERSLRADIDREDAAFANKITVKKYLKQWLDTVVKQVVKWRHPDKKKNAAVPAASSL